MNQRGQGGSARSFPSQTPRGGCRKPPKTPLRPPHPLRARGMLVPWPAPARGRGEELGARFPTSLLELVPGAPQASSSRSHFNSGQTFLLFAPAPPRRRLRLRLVAPGEFLRIQDVEDGEGGDPMRGVGGLLGPSVQALRHPPLLSALGGGGPGAAAAAAASSRSRRRGAGASEREQRGGEAGRRGRRRGGGRGGGRAAIGKQPRAPLPAAELRGGAASAAFPRRGAPGGAGGAPSPGASPPEPPGGRGGDGGEG